MSLSVGIIGLPNVGKSTLFRALTRKEVPRENYPFCTIDPSVGVVPVSDRRLDLLAELSHSERKIPAVIEFTDIAGLVRGAAEGEGLGNQFLAHVREADAMAEVIRIFEDENIAHVEGGLDPLRDLHTINTELILKDIETIEKRLSGIEKEVKIGSAPALSEKNILLRVKAALESEQFALSAAESEADRAVVKRTNLLTAKPVLYVLNRKIGGRNLDGDGEARYKELVKYLKDNGFRYVHVDAATEGDIREFSPEEARGYREELGVRESGIDNLIQESFRLLGLITFFTTGPAETRGWMVARGSTAPEAGAAIHSDFRDRFIRAEVISCGDLLRASGYARAREHGLVRTEGREYVVKDGDVILFKI